ncbi:MAG: DUF6056 family protein [Muribaculum sp.]|nr:DUF6056 family protein [Muribaculum sp.]
MSAMNHHSSENKHGLILSYIMLAIFAVFVCIWRSMLPLVNDDLMYSHTVLPDEPLFWDAYGDPISSWGDVFDSCVQHWLVINGRLTNIITFIVLYSPSWIRVALSTFIITATIWMIVVIACGKKGMQSSWMVALLMLLSWKLLPWNDHMASTCYYLNYALPGLMALLFAWIFLSKRKYTSIEMAVIMLFSFLLGWMHEGISLPLCAAGCVCLFVDKTEVRNKVLIITALAAGTALVVFAPSTLARASREAGEQYDFKTVVLKIIPFLYSLYLYVGILILVWWRRGWKCVKQNLRGGIFWLTLSVATIAMCVVLGLTGRMFWALDLAFMILSYRALYYNFEYCRHPHKFIAIIVTVIFAAFMALIIHWQHRLTEINDEIVAQITASNRPIAYTELILPQNIPWYTMGLLYTFDIPNLGYIANSYLPDKSYKGKIVLVLPRSWGGLPYEKWPKIPGKNNFRGQDYLLCSPDSLPENTEIWVTYGEDMPSMHPVKSLLRRVLSSPNRKKATETHIYKCVTEQNQTLYWYEPITDAASVHQRIISIDINEP